MNITFKGIKVKKGKHIFSYSIEEVKPKADIKTIVTVTLEDTDMVPSMPLEDLVVNCSEIAKKEYQNR